MPVSILILSQLLLLPFTVIAHRQCFKARSAYKEKLESFYNRLGDWQEDFYRYAEAREYSSLYRDQLKELYGISDGPPTFGSSVGGSRRVYRGWRTAFWLSIAFHLSMIIIYVIKWRT